MNPPNTMLKVIVLVHFVLSLWASQSPFFLPTSYIYLHAFILTFGIIAIFCPESSDSVLMFIVSLLISIIQDIIFLGIYEPLGQRNIHGYQVTVTQIGEFRFSLGMCILNLLIKPVSIILLLRILKSRTTDYDNFNFPGMNNIPGFGAAGQSGGTYENIDQAPPYTPSAPQQDNREKSGFP